MDAIEQVKDIIQASDCLDKILILVALEEISKPVSEEFLKQPIETCGGCAFFKIECQCPFNEV